MLRGQFLSNDVTRLKKKGGGSMVFARGNTMGFFMDLKVIDIWWAIHPGFNQRYILNVMLGIHSLNFGGYNIWFKYDIFIDLLFINLDFFVPCTSTLINLFFFTYILFLPWAYQLMTNWWFPVVWIFGIPFWKQLLLLRIRIPNDQFISSWQFPPQNHIRIRESGLPGKHVRKVANSVWQVESYAHFESQTTNKTTPWN